jgi:hypothetical protein
MERWTQPRRYASIQLDPEKYMVWTPFVATQEKADKMARRRDEYEARKLPLFADQLSPTDPNDYLVGSKEWADKFNFSLRKDFRKARLCKFVLAKHLSTEQMAKLEARRGCMPASAEYEVTFWRERLKEQVEGTLTIEYDFPKKRGTG